MPVSIGIALFLTELAPRRLRGPVITVIDLLAAIPSVVFGLWGILVVGAAIVHGLPRGSTTLVGGVPVLGIALRRRRSSTGRGFMTAGLILAIMIIPIITSITREVFAHRPGAEKHAALALGATRWEMIKGAVFPHSFGGMVGAVMLGLGRAMGETIARRADHRCRHPDHRQPVRRGQRAAGGHRPELGRGRRHAPRPR